MSHEIAYMKGSYRDAVHRWAGVGPYYAMFPLDFSFETIGRYSESGGHVFDPFSGRGSSIYAAAMQNRCGTGIEISPVGWLYSQAKLNAGSHSWVIKRLKEIDSTKRDFAAEANDLPEFFHFAYSLDVRQFLLATRSLLNWKASRPDATLMAITLVYLHGKLGQALSNQMRQAKSMSQEYSVRWWKENYPVPPQIDPFEFMLQRINWRYAKGIPNRTSSRVLLGDSSILTHKLVSEVSQQQTPRINLLFTSPPYYAVTNYFADQWLRLWLLGGPDKPESLGEKYKGRFQSKENYEELLQNVFYSASEMMDRQSVVYVRTDAREFTQATTRSILKDCFPEWKETLIPQPFKGRTQTVLYGDFSSKPGEMDIVLTSKHLDFPLQ